MGTGGPNQFVVMKDDLKALAADIKETVKGEIADLRKDLLYVTMKKAQKIFYILALFAVVGFIYNFYINVFGSTTISPTDVLIRGNGIIFLETTDRMELPSLVLCAIESAARVYNDKPVVFFMKGLPDIHKKEDENRARKRYPTLLSFENVYLFPLRMEQLFNGTPLLPWYMKIDPKQERHWVHVSSDGCRLASIWKYGGIYFDSDVISTQPLPDKNFLAAERSQTSGNAVFGLSPHHNFSWICMNNFVQDYRGEVWGYQGPILFTRVLKQLCNLPNFKAVEDILCGNISFLNPQRFYPIPYPEWTKYYEVWEKLPTFNDSYALHLWNYMNRGQKSLVPGSNTLVDHLYQQYCPTIYEALKNNNFYINVFGSTTISPANVLIRGNGIIFLETTDKMDLSSLVLCAIESAARVYNDKPVVFFMKGLPDIQTKEDENRARKRYPTLLPFENVYLFPLRMEQLFNGTPLLPWYMKIDPKQEPHWVHVSSDGCRLASIWKYGGIYFDSDVISTRPVPDKNFLAAERSQTSSNGVFGLSPHHNFSWICMNNFVQNYKGAVWGFQGPILFTRVLKQLCNLPNFKGVEDILCGNISFLNPQRFYPIPFPKWKRYYEVWEKLPTFNNSYALHLWNYMNRGQKSLVPGSNTLVDHLYQQYCPTIYEALKHNKPTFI
ncbi:uncharacterized protein WCC33_003026 [Rhinophrynus dorsalis]